MSFKQGRYVPRNPKKYVGDVNKIRYMSSWELKMHEFLDNNPNIINWASEEIAIPYLKPTDHRVHRYYPDYWIKFRNKSGEIVQQILEVKPAAQTRQPTSRKRKQRVYEQVTYAINVAKWQAAQSFCNKYGMKFQIVTENDIFK